MTAEPLTPWIGRSESGQDTITAAYLAGLAATLDHVDPPWMADSVPPLDHWLHFLPRARQAEIAGDGLLVDLFPRHRPERRMTAELEAA